MDFETELQELIQAALEAGVKPKKIADALQAGSVAFADQESEEDEDDEEEEDGDDEFKT